MSYTRSKSFKVGLVQHACIQDQNSNLKAAIEGIRTASKQGAQIICLQELFHWTYFCTTEDHANFKVALRPDSEILKELQKLAKELAVVIIAPYFEQRAAGLYHNSAVVYDADGSDLGQYRKMHIPDDPLYYEKFYFTPGDVVDENGGFRIFKTRYADIGILICWDQWYPEGARITALLGAEILFYPTAIGWHPAEKADFGPAQVHAWQTIQKSHAIANGVFVAAANRVGHEATPGTEGIEFFGHSFMVDPFARTLVEDKSGKAGVLVAECDRSLIDQTRTHWPFLRDRRIDAYGPILKRYLGA